MYIIAKMNQGDNTGADTPVSYRGIGRNDLVGKRRASQGLAERSESSEEGSFPQKAKKDIPPPSFRKCRWLCAV